MAWSGHQAGRAALPALAAVLSIALASGCGARAQEPAPDPQAERISQLVEQRDALVQRIAQLEHEVELLSLRPVMQAAPPRDHLRATVVRRWIKQITSDEDALIMQLCVRSFELDQVFGGQAVFFTSDLCGEVRTSRGETDPAITIPALLANEGFACWMLAAPERAVPECYRQFGTVQKP